MGGLNLNRSVWYVQAYFWALNLIDKFAGDYPYRASVARTNGANLCSFVRVLCLWAPLILLAQITSVVAVVMAAVVIPVALFGGGTVLNTVLLIIGVTVAVVAIAFAVSGVVWLLGKGKDVVVDGIEDYSTKRTAYLEETGKLPFWQLIGKYYKAKKGKYCPTISFVKEG